MSGGTHDIAKLWIEGWWFICYVEFYLCTYSNVILSIYLSIYLSILLGTGQSSAISAVTGWLWCPLTSQSCRRSCVSFASCNSFLVAKRNIWSSGWDFSRTPSCCVHPEIRCPNLDVWMLFLVKCFVSNLEGWLSAAVQFGSFQKIFAS